MAVIAAGFGGAAASVVFATTTAVLGSLSFAFALVVGAAAAYAVASEPKRSLERSAIMQAREAPALAASAAVYLQSTGSRARTVLMLSSEEPRLRSLFERAKSSTLLGMDPAESLKDGEVVRSDSISMVLSAIARAQGERLSDGGEEAEGIINGSTASEETKFPAFLTVSFFMPVMLMLLAAIGHHDDPLSVASLGLLEVVLLDVALTFASSERRRLAQ